MDETAAPAPVVVVGAGLAGLACALELQSRGVPCTVLEASDGVGGRVRTDDLEGFRLDRGFQILLTAYPEARRVLDYAALDLRAFYPGALVRHGGRFVRVADPTRRPLAGIRALFSPPGGVRDKLRVLRLRCDSRRGSLEDLWQRPETTTAEALLQRGFSASMRSGFFQPWLSGVFLEQDLRTSSRMLEFVFRMFSTGANAVPAEGMGRIPEQMAARLEPGSLRLRAPVERILPGAVGLAGGERLEAARVVLAVEGPTAADLVAGIDDPGSRRVHCLYFAAEKDPLGEPVLVLDGEGRGPVTNLSVMSAVSAAYAPPGAALIAASVIGDPQDDPAALQGAVRDQVRGWFGPAVDGWRHLRTYRIPHALPERWGAPDARRLPDGVLAAGDWCESPSIQGALVSGRRAAEALLGTRTPSP